MKDVIDLLGRIFLSFISIYEAVDSIFFFGKTQQTMIEYGLNSYQDIVLTGAIILLVVGSISVAIGYYAKAGAWLLIAYWTINTFVIFSFWNDDPDLRAGNAVDFMRNLSYIGGLLVLAANGAGKISIRRLIYVMRLPK